MVRNYKKKSTRGSWPMENMKKAIDAVLSKTAGYRKAAHLYGVPQTTLERHVAKIRKGELSLEATPGNFKPVFSKHEEEELVTYVIEMEKRLFGLTTVGLRKLAYQLAEKNSKAHNFNHDKKIAGLDWLKGFLKRHPDLSIRKPEATSAARAMGFNKVAVDKFYSLLGEIYDKYNLTPDRIYNCDETGISCVSKTKSKIIAEKGRKQRMKQELLDRAPPGTTAECNAKGWMTSEVFMSWFQRFVRFCGASITNPVLLLLDGHITHTQNIEVIEYARKSGVVMLCFPPHCTHRLQPLDVGFMKPLSVYYDHACSNWLRSHPGRIITTFQISEIFANAYIQAATMSTAINAFKKCGIWPFNQNNFTESDFLAASTTDVPLAHEPGIDEPSNVEIQQQQPPILEEHPLEPDLPASTTPNNPHPTTAISEPQPGPSSLNVHRLIRSPVRKVCRDLTTSFENASPQEILAIPTVEQRHQTRKNYRRGKTVVLTSTPYKNELEEREQLKRTKKCSNPNDPKLKKNSKKQKTEKARSNVENVDEDTTCIYCLDANHTYLKSSEGWVACQLCGRWAHTACAGVDDENIEEVHICLYCDAK
ncbi:MFS-type transporter clz9 isoform X2 [Plutella xylostella]|uniref:MFS-type transporter clz9 isoform X2 n=1 Tax=Plutella xylostella TaxID=51655 RepID=UPI0018D15FAD|nr:MFS-type transporter clz9 isoform X2 [Plutella xylostella]